MNWAITGRKKTGPSLGEIDFHKALIGKNPGAGDCVCYNRLRFHGGYSSMVERRSVAPDGVGSSPTTHPKEPFSFNRLAYARVH